MIPGLPEQLLKVILKIPLVIVRYFFGHSYQSNVIFGSTRSPPPLR